MVVKVLIVIGCATALFVAVFTVVVARLVLRPDRVEPTYQVVGAVYRDQEGVEWIVFAPGQLSVLGESKRVLAPARLVEKGWGPLVYMRHEDVSER